MICDNDRGTLLTPWVSALFVITVSEGWVIFTYVFSSKASFGLDSLTSFG